ncbi:MAG: polyhydroxyalkanoic acid system family protein [Flavitalea sp.]
MSSMDIKIPHQLSKEEALKRIQGLLAATKKDYGDKISDLQENWEGDTGNFSFRAMGFNVSGELQVTDENVEFKGKVPIALSMFKGKIEELIKEKASGLLSK